MNRNKSASQQEISTGQGSDAVIQVRVVACSAAAVCVLSLKDELRTRRNECSVRSCVV
jgi:hypothetical protein